MKINDEHIRLKSTIIDKDNEIVSVCDEMSICAKDIHIKANVLVKNPLLWDIEGPNLYKVITTIKG